MNLLEIYEKAQEIGDPAARRRYLDEACAGDTALRDRVIGMLELPEDLPSFLTTPIFEARRGQGSVPTADGPPEGASGDPLLGVSIGGVTLERSIGQGGMGKVYVGTQASTGGLVAVKLLLPQVVSDGMLKRFEVETRILGRLRHPAIAQIHSAGTFGIGGVRFPYFVMENIADAMPITDYAESKGLDTRQRVELFRRACEGVAHGHEIGVIHRDLKPANILVDRFGQPKVIDFGVAKCTAADGSMTTLTASGDMVGTPRYMSPEQIGGGEDAVTIRSDVHALGMILYELLARDLPFDFKNAVPVGVAQIILSQEPKPLSGVSAAFRGDLDAITARCLEKDGRDRFASAGDLGAEIGRFLEDKPILTRPVGFLGGLLRLARKHKAAAATSAAFLVVLVGAIAAIGVAARRESVARLRAETETRKALWQSYATEVGRAGNALRADDLPAASDAFHKAWSLMPGDEKADSFDPSRLPIELAALRGRMTSASVSLSLADPGLDGCADLAISADGATLAVGHGSGQVSVFCIGAESGHRFTIPKAHAGTADRVIFSAVGRLLASASPHDESTAVWDATDGSLVWRLAPTDGPIAFSPDGSTIASAHGLGPIRLWSLRTGELSRELPDQDLGVRSIAFSPDGGRLVVSGGRAFGGAEVRCTRVWDLADGTELLVDSAIGRHEGVATFAPDGTRLLHAGDDGTARLFDTASGALLESMPGGDGFPLQAARFMTADGQVLTVSRSGQATIWRSGAEVHAVRLPLPEGQLFFGEVAIDAEGAVVLADDRRTWVWRPASAGPPAELRMQIVRSAAGRSGELLLRLTADGRRLAIGAMDGTVEIRDVDAPPTSLVGHAARVESVAFSSDGRRIATAADDRTVRIWNAETGRPLAATPVAPDSTAVAFAPATPRLVMEQFRDSGAVWDLEKGSLGPLPGDGEPGVERVGHGYDAKEMFRPSLLVPPAPWSVETRTATREAIAAVSDLSRLLTVAVDPTGKRLAALRTPTDEEPTLALRVEDLTTSRRWTIDLPPPVGFATHPTSLRFSGDGGRLACPYGRTILTWTLADAPEEGPVLLAEHSVDVIEFSPDGSRLIGGTKNGQISIWNPATGDLLVTLDGHDRAITCLAFSPDGRRFVSGADDGSVRLWGCTAAEIHDAWRASEARRATLRPLVDRLLAGEAPDTGSLSAPEAAELSDMLLERRGPPIAPGP